VTTGGLVTNISGQPIGRISKGQAVYNACLTLEDQKNWLSRKVGLLDPLRWDRQAIAQHQPLTTNQCQVCLTLGKGTKMLP